MGNDPGISDDYLPMDAKRLLERMHTALNTRDVENLIRCFQVDYESEYPAHPGRGVMGLGQLAEIWQRLFDQAPQFRADLAASTFEGSIGWAEWHWYDAADTARLDQRGVMIYGVEDGLIAWSRMYMEPVRPWGEVASGPYGA